MQHTIRSLGALRDARCARGAVSPGQTCARQSSHGTLYGMARRRLHAACQVVGRRSQPEALRTSAEGEHDRKANVASRQGMAHGGEERDRRNGTPLSARSTSPASPVTLSSFPPLPPFACRIHHIILLFRNQATRRLGYNTNTTTAKSESTEHTMQGCRGEGCEASIRCEEAGGRVVVSASRLCERAWSGGWRRGRGRGGGP